MRNGERPPQTWDDSTPIGKMGLNARARNALLREGRTTLGSIADMTVRELLAIQSLGAGSVGNIVNQADQLDLAARAELLEQRSGELAARVALLEQQVRELRVRAGFGGAGGGVHDPDRGAEPGR